MDQAVVQFIQALRHHGLPVSPAETLDALNAAALIGVSDRQRLKTCFGMTLAKNLAHRGVLDNLFDEFFAVSEPERPSVPAAGAAGAAPSDGEVLQSSLGRQLHHDQLAALHQAMVQAGEAAGARQMQIFLQKNVVVNRILRQMGDRELQQELRQLEAEGRHLDLVAQLQSRRQQLVDRVRDYTERQYLLFSARKGVSLADDVLHRISFRNIDHVQQRQMARLVTRIARKLASLHARRRKVYKRGLLDVRKTIAANAAFDGYLYHTRWKSTRVERPRLMVLCDVSGSVSQMAQFLLLFVYSLQDVLPAVRSFVFTNQAVEVTNAFKAYHLDTALNMIMDHWANQSTDYGKALADFSELALKDIDHKTQLIVLGDARNNGGDPRPDLLKTLCNRAQRVLWLNPEPRSRWNTGDSVMREYGVHCSMVEHCSSLRDLERILGRLLKYAG